MFSERAEQSCLRSSDKLIDSYFCSGITVIRVSLAKNPSAPGPQPSREPTAERPRTLVLPAAFRLCSLVLALANRTRLAMARFGPPLRSPRSPHPPSSFASQSFRARCSCFARLDQAQSLRSTPSAPQDSSVLPGREFPGCCEIARFPLGRWTTPALHDIGARHRSAGYVFAATLPDCSAPTPDRGSGGPPPESVAPRAPADLAPPAPLRNHFQQTRCSWLLRACARTACSYRASSRSALPSRRRPGPAPAEKSQWEFLFASASPPPNRQSAKLKQRAI